MSKKNASKVPGAEQMLHNSLLLFLLKNGRRIEACIFFKVPYGTGTQLSDICTFCFIIFKITLHCWDFSPHFRDGETKVLIG